MRRQAIFLASLISLSLVLSACAVIDGPRADPCRDAARQWGDGFTVAGSFASTAAQVKKSIPAALPYFASSARPDDPVNLCFIDGDFPSAPRPIGSEVPRNYDRAVVIVVNGKADAVEFGYRERVPIVNPNERPADS
jgi:hypothetical protein